MKRILTGLLLMGIILYVGISWYFSSIILNPNAGDPVKRSARMAEIDGPNAEPVHEWVSIPDTFAIKTDDGKMLRGWYFYADSASCNVIMAHGHNSYRVEMIKYMYLFKECGCDIVMYDHRGHNVSDDAYATFGIREAEDLLAVTAWVEQEKGYDEQQIGWLGISWGGATVLQAGGDETEVAFIISDAPFQDWYAAVMERAIRDYGSWVKVFVPMIKIMIDSRAGVDFDDASALIQASHISEPVFLIHSRADSATASRQSVNIAKALNPETSVFHHTDWGNDHADDIRNNPEEYKLLVDQFLNSYVDKFGKCE